MDWRTSFDCDSFLDKERNHHGYYWLDTVALTSFIENLLEQERKRISVEMADLLKESDCHESFLEGYRNGCPVENYNQAITDVLAIINKK